MVLALTVMLIALWSSPAHAANLIVNRTGDAPDINLANAACDSNASQAGNQCTLRAAIQEANDTAVADTINFNIGTNDSLKTISPTSRLPTIGEQVTINGYSQTGASPNTLSEGNDAILKVQLNGTNAGPDTSGLRIEAADCTIKGLAINRVVGTGILIIGSGATGVRIEGNFIGTNAAGTTDLGNTTSGVTISSASNNTVGGTTSAARNLISGNDSDGISIVRQRRVEQ